jgi:predicted metal-dependent enzyme (double-stranded beta helix superfamily)
VAEANVVTVLYKPFGVLISVLGGILAGMAFKRIWRAVAGEDDSPNATDKQRTWSEVLIAATAEGALYGVVKAAINRAGATGFARATGTWPGNEESPTKDGKA